jgi:hypothetical protein
MYYPNSQQEVISDHLFVFIDYGSSHITLEGKDYGRIFPEGNIYNRTFWIHDIFKIMMFLYYLISSKSMEMSKKRVDIYKYMRDDYSMERLREFEAELTILENAYINNGGNLRTIREYLGTLFEFFIGRNMDEPTFENFYNYNVYFAVRYMKKFEASKFDFKEFVDFVSTK